MDKELIKKINDEIWDKDDFICEMYYQVRYNKCKNLEYYFEKYNVTNLETRIFLAQHWGRDDLAKIEFSKIELDNYQKNLLNNIYNVNQSCYETLNPGILNSKYEFLKSSLEFISTDIRTQELLLSLDDEELYLFKKIYLKLNDETSNVIPYICRILDYVGETVTASGRSLVTFKGNMFNKKSEQFKKLSKELFDIELSSDVLNKIIYIFSNNNIEYSVESLDDLNNFDKELINYINNSIEEHEKNDNNIDELKSLVLMRSYGIELEYAKYILERYYINNIIIEDYNNPIMSIYESITHIVNEKDKNKLLNVFNEINKNSDFKLDYLFTALLEDGLRDIFLNHLNNETFKCEGKYDEIDGVKVYDAGVDFKIILTSVGAYQPELETQSNYFEYWNQKSIRSHGNCCSLVANNNLTTASIKNICLGFSNFPNGSLLLSGIYDLNSTPTSRQINSQDHWTTFMSANDLIDSTRSDYNELVFERRDLSEDKANFKKNPDYIVFFEEFDKEYNLDEVDEKTKILLQEQQKIYMNSIQAAKDFNVPLVKINREKCAKNEISKIENMINEYTITKDSALINRIIIEYENNRTGLSEPHDILRNKYFSTEKMEETIKKIVEITNSITDERIRNYNLESLKNTIDLEINKYKIVKDKLLLHYNQESSLINLNIDRLIYKDILDNNGGIKK